MEKLVNVLVPPNPIMLMTGVWRVEQEASDKPVTLYYTDGQTEKSDYIGDILEEENFFTIVSKVQSKREVK